MFSLLEEVPIQTFRNEAGLLRVSEGPFFHKFEVKRLYFISNVPKNAIRGAHAHKDLEQIFFALAGSFTLSVTDGHNSDTIVMNENNNGYYLPTGVWREISNFTKGAICLVLASKEFDVDDYILSYDEFLKWKKSTK